MKFLKEVFLHYWRANTYEKGAALSYYAAFSILPILMILISIIGIIFPEDLISEELRKQLQGIVGEKGADQLEAIIKNQHLYQNNLLTTTIGIGTLALAATGMFNQIQKSLNSIWGIKVKAKNSISNYFLRRLSSFIILLIIGFTLLLSTTINGFILKFSSNLPDAFAYAHLYEAGFSFVLITMLFAIFFKFLGNAIVPWKPALVASGITSVLFIIGKIALGIYIAQSNMNSSFGAASVLVILMFWVYYTSQILFLGASFAYIYGKKIGKEIEPSHMAVRFVQQELPKKEL